MRLFFLFAFLLFANVSLNAAEFGLKVSLPEGSIDFEVKNGIKTGFESAIFALPQYFEEGSDLKIKILVIEGRNKIDITATSKGRMKVSEKVSGLKREAVLLGKNLAIRFAKKLLRKKGISLSKADTAIMAGGKISSRKKKQVIVFDLRGDGSKKLKRTLSGLVRSTLAALPALDVKDKALMDNQMLDAGLSKEQCTDLSCQIEIAGALGVEEAVTGEISKISNLTIITLNRVAIDTNSTIQTKTFKSKSSSTEDLIDAISKLSKELYNFSDKPENYYLNEQSIKDQIEIELWNNIRNSKDISDFQYYLNAYPKGKYKILAKVKIKKLKSMIFEKEDDLVSGKMDFSKIDLLNCKAKEYFSEAKSKLLLKPKWWCGDLNDRFKLVNSGTKYIYDRFLKGYWSKASIDKFKWNDALSYCEVNGWQLPNVYQLLSLISFDEIDEKIYINSLFFDTNKDWFWSSTKEQSSKAWYFYFLKGRVSTRDLSKLAKVRCFLPK